MFLEFMVEPVKNWTQVAASLGYLLALDADASLIRVTAGFTASRGVRIPAPRARVFLPALRF